MNKLKKLVYKNRIRVKDFLSDYDKLRGGYINPNNFLSALSSAKIDAELSPKELQTIADAYTVQRTPSLVSVDYRCAVPHTSPGGCCNGDEPPWCTIQHQLGKTQHA